MRSDIAPAVLRTTLSKLTTQPPCLFNQVRQIPCLKDEETEILVRYNAKGSGPLLKRTVGLSTINLQPSTAKRFVIRSKDLYAAA